MGEGKLIEQLIARSEDADFTSSLNALKEQYEQGIWIDYLDIAACVNSACRATTAVQAQPSWKVRCLKLMEQHRPDVELCILCRRRGQLHL